MSKSTKLTCRFPHDIFAFPQPITWFSQNYGFLQKEIMHFDLFKHKKYFFLIFLDSAAPAAPKIIRKNPKIEGAVFHFTTTFDQ